jgi:surfeit locus 1 family protein
VTDDARRSLLVPAIAAAAAFVVLISLGVWQLERKAWKEALLATLDERVTAAPVPLPPATDWPRLKRDDWEYRRVVFRAEYLPERTGQRGSDGRVWGVGSALRDDIKAPGIFIFTPAKLPTGDLVVVLRGAVADPKPSWRTPVPPVVTGPADIVGILRWPEPGSWFMVTSYDATQDIWFVRDQIAMAEANRWGRPGPFYVERESQTPPDGFPPLAGGFKPSLPNNHLGYALTWLGLALVLAISFGAWVRFRNRSTVSGEG